MEDYDHDSKNRERYCIYMTGYLCALRGFFRSGKRHGICFVSQYEREVEL